jgi:hypothetical protein
MFINISISVITNDNIKPIQEHINPSEIKLKLNIT